MTIQMAQLRCKGPSRLDPSHPFDHPGFPYRTGGLDLAVLANSLRRINLWSRNRP